MRRYLCCNLDGWHLDRVKIMTRLRELVPGCRARAAFLVWTIMSGWTQPRQLAFMSRDGGRALCLAVWALVRRLTREHHVVDGRPIRPESFVRLLAIPFRLTGDRRGDLLRRPAIPSLDRRSARRVCDDQDNRPRVSEKSTVIYKPRNPARRFLDRRAREWKKKSTTAMSSEGCFYVKVAASDQDF